LARATKAHLGETLAPYSKQSFLFKPKTYPRLLVPLKVIKEQNSGKIFCEGRKEILSDTDIWKGVVTKVREQSKCKIWRMNEEC
jgi:hypothetical protein